MGNCIKHCSQSRPGKQDDGMKQLQAEYFKEEKKKSKACVSDGGRVVRVKVVVTRKELEKFLRHNNNKQRTSEYIFDDDVMIKLMTLGGRCRRTTRDGDVVTDEWKPNLETIPED